MTCVIMEQITSLEISLPSESTFVIMSTFPQTNKESVQCVSSKFGAKTPKKPHLDYLENVQPNNVGLFNDRNSIQAR